MPYCLDLDLAVIIVIRERAFCVDFDASWRLVKCNIYIIGCLGKGRKMLLNFSVMKTASLVAGC